MTDEHPEPDVDRVLADLPAWADDDRAAAAARSRSRRAWLRQQAGESTTLLGLLVTMAEAGTAVTIGTAAGPFSGTVSQVASSLCAVDLTAPGGGVALIPISAITAVEGGHGGDIADDRAPQMGVSLVALLAARAAQRPPIDVHLGQGKAVVGVLTNVGADVISVRPDRDHAPVVHIPIGAIAACVLR